jgi:hypothetical protein
MLTTDRKNQKQRLLPQRTRRITEEGKGLPRITRINADQEKQHLPRRHGEKLKTGRLRMLVFKSALIDFIRGSFFSSRLSFVILRVLCGKSFGFSAHGAHGAYPITSGQAFTAFTDHMVYGAQHVFCAGAGGYESVG